MDEFRPVWHVLQPLKDFLLKSNTWVLYICSGVNMSWPKAARGRVTAAVAATEEL